MRERSTPLGRVEAWRDRPDHLLRSAWAASRIPMFASGEMLLNGSLIVVSPPWPPVRRSVEPSTRHVQVSDEPDNGPSSASSALTETGSSMPEAS